MTKNSLFFIFQILLSIISPLLAFPLVLVSIYKGDEKSLYVLGYILAVLICIIPPAGDAFHYYLYFQDVEYISIKSWFTEEKDLLFYYLAYIFKSIGINYYFFRFFLTLFCLISIMWIFKNILKNNKNIKDNKNYYVLSFLIILFSIYYINISWGIRYGFMSTCILLSIYFIDKNNILLSLVFAFIGTSMHFTALMFIPAILLGYAFKNKTFSLSEKIILTLICFFSGKFLFDYIYGYVPEFLHSDYYLTDFSDSNKSFNGQMESLIRTKIVSSILIFVFFTFKYYKSVFVNITFFIILSFFTVWCYDALRDRIWITLSLILAFSFISIISNHKNIILKNKLIIILFLFFFLQCMTIYSRREQVFSKETLSGFLCPINLIYQEKYDMTYFFRKGLY